MGDELIWREERDGWQVECYRDSDGRLYTKYTPPDHLELEALFLDNSYIEALAQMGPPPNASELLTKSLDSVWGVTKNEGIMAENRVSTIRDTFDKLLAELKQLKELAGRSEDGRQAAIVYTQVELAEAYFQVKFGGGA